MDHLPTDTRPSFITSSFARHTYYATLTTLQSKKDDNDRSSLCRDALGLHPDRREGKIQLRHGMMLQLSYLDPVQMLSGRQAELEATAKAQEVARKTGKAARKKIKVKKEGAVIK